jgi:hypothetical protein
VGIAVSGGVNGRKNLIASPGGRDCLCRGTHGVEGGLAVCVGLSGGQNILQCGREGPEDSTTGGYGCETGLAAAADALALKNVHQVMRILGCKPVRLFEPVSHKKMCGLLPNVWHQRRA